MPIISVSRWSMNPEVASRLVRESAPLIKGHGATMVVIGRVVSGQSIQAGLSQQTGQTGQEPQQEILLSVTYPNWETFGRAMEAQQNDTKLQEQHTTALKSGQLLQRSIIAAEEVQ